MAEPARTLDLASRIYWLLDVRATYDGDQFIAEAARLIHEDRVTAREAAILECAAAIHSKMQLCGAYAQHPHHSAKPGDEALWQDRSLTLWDAKDAVLRLIGKRAPVAGEDQTMLVSEKA